MRILVTGGAGFIGSKFIRYALENSDDDIINLDKLTYAGNLDNLKKVENEANYSFIRGDICDKKLVEKTTKGCNVIINFAAETHVDRSIKDSHIFLKTNILGTHALLETARKFDIGKFVQISSDEVYGSIDTGSFSESGTLNPTSPYSVSKAAADLLVMSYYKTYGLPAVIIRSSNNYGPYQHPEKVIPLFITNLLENKKVPLYGNGLNVRDWLHVSDNCSAIMFIVQKGKTGEIYNVGSGCERTNLEATRDILRLLNKGEEYINYVEDRPAHDRRYSLNCDKIKSLGWSPEIDFETGIKSTVEWYKSNKWWWKPLRK